MEPVYCPQGHPNRPGTRICIVCRELIAPSSPPAPSRNPLPPEPDGPTSRAVTPPPIYPPATKQSTANKTSPGEKQVAPGRRRRWWLWLLLLLLVAAGGVAFLLSMVYPLRRTTTIAPSEPAASAPAIVADTATSAPSPTDPPAQTPSPPPTATSPAATGSPTPVATITPLPTILGVVITPTLVFGPEVNFIQNGSFTDDWANGWTLESRGEAAEVEVGPATDEPESQSLRLARSGPGMSRLAQRVVLTFPVEGLVFRGRFRLAGSSEGDTEGRAVVLLRYEDSNGDPLGTTVWLDGSAAASELWGIIPLPVLGPTVSERYAREGWQSIELPLAQEFAGTLPDVDMEAVRQITVMLGVIGSETCPAASCEATVEVAELSLTAEVP